MGIVCYCKLTLHRWLVTENTDPVPGAESKLMSTRFEKGKTNFNELVDKKVTNFGVSRTALLSEGNVGFF